MRQTFRVPSVWQPWLPLAFFGVVAVLILGMVTPPDEWFIVGIAAAVLVVAAAIGLWLLTRTRLAITPEGITYHAIGYRAWAAGRM